LKLGCYTKFIFTIIFVIGVGYYIIDKYVITQFSENINNFQSAYKDSLSKYLLEKINTDQIDFNSVKEYVLQIKDFNLLEEEDKFLHIKKLLEKDGTQN
jgi:hypothetical protein